MPVHRYPLEQEVAFPPLTAQQPLGSRVDGTCLVFELLLAPPSSYRAAPTETLSQQVACRTRAPKHSRLPHPSPLALALAAPEPEPQPC